MRPLILISIILIIFAHPAFAEKKTYICFGEAILGGSTSLKIHFTDDTFMYEEPNLPIVPSYPIIAEKSDYVVASKDDVLWHFVKYSKELWHMNFRMKQYKLIAQCR